MMTNWITCPAYAGQPYRRPWGDERHSMADLPAGGEGLPAFRYRFRCPEAPVGALIEASALGIFEL